jgi:phosphatidylinositol alpha-1,6-mannosyltransferase
LGHWTALVLMVLAGAAVGAWMIVRPPRDAHVAGRRLTLGLALLFVLAPASRVGYFVYPLGLGAWLLLARWPELPGDLSVDLSVDPEPQHRRLAVQGHH